MILLAAGVVVYIEESRQTKLDPFLFSRDLVFYVLCLCLVLIAVWKEYTTIIPIVLLCVGFLFLILQYLNSYLQYKFYKVFNLI